MEGRPMVCYSMGTINSLIDKITQLGKIHPMIDDLLPGLEILRQDHVNKFARGRATGEQAKVWMKQAREMVYDIEDWIDLKQEAASFEESDKAQIDEFKDLIQEALDRCKRYELLNQAPHSDAQPVHAGSSEVAFIGHGWIWEKTLLVGINGPKSELLNHLGNEQKELKVVCILGTGGCGKSTLAKEVYGEIKTQFDCHAFVSVGRITSIRTILMQILHQVKSETDARQATRCKEEQINEVIAELWGFLRTRRYFICIDDIQCSWASKVLNCALPSNNLGSRILSTTRIKDIAISCSRLPSDVVYEMTLLREDDSKSLFLNSVHVREEEWPDHFKETSRKIFEVCGGVPLAIIITAGLLGRTFGELSVQSKMLNETFLSEVTRFYSTSQAMKIILDISFGDLPLALKSCFLYLSSFSGSYQINKDHLIRRWVAEGLIPERHGKSSWETGESYFEELISRRLIQPAFDDNDDQPTGCTVHSVVADFIESLSTEENFVTADAKLKCGLFPCDRVRRVSLDCTEEDGSDILFSNAYSFVEQNSWVASSTDENSSSDEDEEISVHLSKVRSLAFSGDAGRIPDLSAFKHVRVLDLEDTKGFENKQMESIGCLSLLRYLGLGRTDVTKLPQQIMALEHLSTLDLRRTRVRQLPAFRDTNLVSLLADELIMQRGMGEMQQLEELSKVLLGQDGSLADDMVGLVRNLRRLRMLGVRFGRLYETDQQGVKCFLEEVGKSNLQSLLLDNYLYSLLDLLFDSWAQKRPHYLEKFELRIRSCLLLVPQKIASLVALTHLHIKVDIVEAEGVRALGKLPNLVLLKLDSHSSSRFIVSSKDGYQCLKVFWYDCNCGGGMGLQFEAGTMPRLRRLRLDFNVRETMSKYGGFDFGIQHLCCLVQVCATINCKYTPTASEVEAAEANIRHQVSQNPNNPILELNRSGYGHLMPHQWQYSVANTVVDIHSLDEWSIQIDEANNADPKKLVVIHFTASGCIPSHQVAPVFADLAKEFPNVVFLKVDVDEMETISQEFHVEKMPTFLFMKGGDIKDRVIGVRTDMNMKNMLAEKLQQQMAQ